MAGVAAQANLSGHLETISRQWYCFTMAQEPRDLSNSVRRNLLKRSAANEVAVVVPKKGKPSRVYTFASYQRIRENAMSTKPWEHRAKPNEPPDPLNAKHGRVTSRLSRRDLYETAVAPEDHPGMRARVRWDPDQTVTVVAEKNPNRKSDEEYDLVEDLLKLRQRTFSMRRLRGIAKKHYEIASHEEFKAFLRALLESEIIKLGPPRSGRGSGRPA